MLIFAVQRSGEADAGKRKSVAGVGGVISLEVRELAFGRVINGWPWRAFAQYRLAVFFLSSRETDMMQPARNTICLWYDGAAEEAARFYADTFPDSAVTAVHRAPGDFPSGNKGDVLTVEFTVLGIPCLGLNGGPGVKHSWAFSFQVATTDQAQTDRYWNAIVGNGGPGQGHC
jgi:predicted 3-demethylubiquinone-9 3-methyltransferase (glyoxalase superfamily)